ncbi:hypothetical protein ACLPG7_21710, partial [Pseudomonas aeruginosa]|uniref:hypothetical protein n=1 Tax=Pseudomonas aeruginosa TaxID=287 RepID=UPI003D277BD4
ASSSALSAMPLPRPATAAGGEMSATDEREAKEITRMLYVNTVFAVVLFWSMAVGRHPFM